MDLAPFLLLLHSYLLCSIAVYIQILDIIIYPIAPDPFSSVAHHSKCGKPIHVYVCRPIKGNQCMDVGRPISWDRAKPPGERLREVYMDESYIHEHYHRNEDSLWDPNDNQDVIYQKDNHKGRWYCFCTAIQGPNPLGGEEPEDLAGLVPGSIWAFSPQKKADHQGDYHKVFNGDNYIPWFRDQLLANLHQPSLIMLDNAAYHCVYGPDVPQWYKLKKQECIDYLVANAIQFDPAMSATEMKQPIGQAVHRQ
jgi:hypothetical protein